MLTQGRETPIPDRLRRVDEPALWAAMVVAIGLVWLLVDVVFTESAAKLGDVSQRIGAHLGIATASFGRRG